MTKAKKVLDRIGEDQKVNQAPKRSPEYEDLSKQIRALSDKLAGMKTGSAEHAAAAKDLKALRDKRAALKEGIPEAKASTLKAGDKFQTYADGEQTVVSVSKSKDGDGRPQLKIKSKGKDGKEHQFTVRPDEDSKDW
jgi:hypothetical protein